jgi:hypothetical protein
MDTATLYMTVAIAGLAATALIAFASLKGFTAWIELKKMEIETLRGVGTPAGSPSAASRIEVADLKERLRKLEAIAAGVDL